jgi:hypothetical protein
MAANDFANKLGICAGQHVYLEGASAEFAAERLTGLPPGCRVATGLVDNKTLTFDDVEYGIRFVVRRELR